MQLAERYDDSDMRIEGHLVLGSFYAFTGNPTLGLQHLEKGIAHIDPTRRPSSRFRLGNHPGVPCYISSALLLWGLGFPDRALRYAENAVQLARSINHPYSLAYALYHTGFLHFWRQEFEASLGYTRQLLEVAEEHRFQIWYAVGSCLQGAGKAILGSAEEGLAQINLGMDIYQDLKSPPVFWPLLRTLQAGVCSMAGNPGQGLAYLEEVLAIKSGGYGDVMMVESLRLKGDLLLALHPPNLAEAEQYYRRALAVTQQHGVIMLELRLAITLTRLLQDQESLRLLGDTYKKFTEGFSTPDLVEARDLLGII